MVVQAFVEPSYGHHGAVVIACKGLASFVDVAHRVVAVEGCVVVVVDDVVGDSTQGRERERVVGVIGIEEPMVERGPQDGGWIEVVEPGSRMKSHVVADQQRQHLVPPQNSWNPLGSLHIEQLILGCYVRGKPSWCYDWKG